MSQPYLGWIPTVLGNLSYQLVGQSGHPFPFFCRIEEPTSGCIEIACLQKRIPFDYQIPLVPLPDKYYLELSNFIAYKFVKENIESSYVLFAKGTPDKTGTVQKLQGRIYRLFKKTNEEQKLVFKHTSQIIENQNYQIDELESFTEKGAYLFCDFELNRQGICEFKNITCLEKGSVLSDDEVDKLYKQFFYFVKDAFHSHQHHDKTEDTLTSSFPKVDENGNLWHDHVLKDIYRYIIRQRLTLDKNSLGIFPYIRTFRKIISSTEPGLNSEKNDRTLNDRTVSLNELEASVTITAEKYENAIGFRRWFIGILLVVLQSSFFYIYSSNKCFYNSFIDQHTVFVFVVAIVILFISLATTKVFQPIKLRSTTASINLLISLFERKTVIPITGAFALIISVIGFWLLYLI